MYSDPVGGYGAEEHSWLLLCGQDLDAAFGSSPCFCPLQGSINQFGSGFNHNHVLCTGDLMTPIVYQLFSLRSLAESAQDRAEIGIYTVISAPYVNSGDLNEFPVLLESHPRPGLVAQHRSWILRNPTAEEDGTIEGRAKARLTRVLLCPVDN